MRRKNKKCCKNCVIRIIRQEEKYDPVKFKNIGCKWIEVEQFHCIEHYQAQSEIDLLEISYAQQHKFEGISQVHVFWIDVSKQDKKTDYNMTLGDYMYFCRTLWKLIGINEVEILNNCYMLKIIGERIYPREYRTLVLETEISDTGTEDDIDALMTDLQQEGVI